MKKTVEGVSLRDEVTHKILKLLIKEPRRSSDFTKPGIIPYSKNTIYKYLKEAVDKHGLVAVRLTDKFKVQFEITEKGKKVITKTLKRQKYGDVGELLESQRQMKLRIAALRLYEKIASLSGEELETFNVKEYYEDLKRKEGL